MKKFSTLILAAAVALVGTLFAPKSAEAIPAFARQVGVACKTCHFTTTQGARLKQFGREFLKGGFTQTSQELIEDDGFSLPPVLNLGFIMKFKYTKTTPHNNPVGDKVGTDRGLLEVPEDNAIWLAGRMAEDFGVAVEFGAGAESAKIVYSHDFGGIQGGLVAYSTTGMGASWSMEAFNTGAAGQHRVFEDVKATAIQSALGGVAMGGATGIHLFASNDLFFANVGLFGPASNRSTNLNGAFGLGKGSGGNDNNNQIDTAFNLSVYYRLALTPQLIDGADIMIGVQGSAGETKLANDLAGQTPTGSGVKTVTTNTTAIDFQLQMDDLGGMPFGLYAAYQNNPKGDAGKVNIYNTGTEDATGASIQATLGFLPNFSGKVAFLNVTNDGTGRKRTATTLGVNIDFAQNVVFGLDYSIWNRDAAASTAATNRASDNKLLAMLQVGF